MSEQEEVREDVPPKPDDERLETGESEWDENEPSPHQGEEGQQGADG
jgi:hypothetical protein